VPNAYERRDKKAYKCAAVVWNQRTDTMYHQHESIETIEEMLMFFYKIIREGSQKL
jgi:hypothetical protein